jgi:hypothetical protein
MMLGSAPYYVGIGHLILSHINDVEVPIMLDGIKFLFRRLYQYDSPTMWRLKPKVSLTDWRADAG